jgi:hypothetical protein
MGLARAAFHQDSALMDRHQAEAHEFRCGTMLACFFARQADAVPKIRWRDNEFLLHATPVSG